MVCVSRFFLTAGAPQEFSSALSSLSLTIFQTFTFINALRKKLGSWVNNGEQKKGISVSLRIYGFRSIRKLISNDASLSFGEVFWILTFCGVVDRFQTGYGAAVISDGSNSYMVTRTGHRGLGLRHYVTDRHSHIFKQQTSGSTIVLQSQNRSPPVSPCLIYQHMGHFHSFSNWEGWRSIKSINPCPATNCPSPMRCSCITSNLLTCDASALSLDGIISPSINQMPLKKYAPRFLRRKNIERIPNHSFIVSRRF